jgi:hypothetical protein
MSADHRAGVQRPRVKWIAIAGALISASSMVAPTIAGASGFSSESAAQIFKTAIQSSSGASSFSVKGTLNQPKMDLTLNLQLSASGMSQGTLLINGAHVQIKEIAGTGYFNADSAFWTQNGGAAEAATLAGKWIYAPISSSLFSGLRPFLSPRPFIHSFFGTDTGPFTKGKLTTVDGTKTVGVMADGPGTMYVQTGGKHYIESISGRDSGSSGSLRFSSYGTAVHPVKPAGAVSLQSLESGQ